MSISEFPEVNVAAIEPWRDGGAALDWHGNEIFYRLGGTEDALPLLMLHGFPTSSLDWVPIWDELTKNHRLIAFDFLGFGFSDKPHPYEYTLVEQADIADALCDRLGISDYHIFAHDYGVSVAQELLARHSGRILSCAFLNGGLLPEQHRARPVQELLAGPDGPEIVKHMTRESFGRGFAEIFGPDTQPSDDELDAHWAVIDEKQGQRVEPALLGYMTERRKHGDRWRTVLTDPSCPLAMINGTLDPVSGGHLCDALEAFDSDIAITRIETVGHYPQIEAPGEVLAAFRQFRANIC